MIFDLINSGADPLSVITPTVLAFVCGFSISTLIHKKW